MKKGNEEYLVYSENKCVKCSKSLEGGLSVLGYDPATGRPFHYTEEEWKNIKEKDGLE